MDEVWDKTIQVGDIITAYHKGYHKVTRIEDRTGNPYAKGTPLFHYRQIANSSGKMINAKRERQCDAAWCVKAVTKLQAEIVERINDLNALRALQAQIVNGML